MIPPESQNIGVGPKPDSRDAKVSVSVFERDVKAVKVVLFPSGDEQRLCVLVPDRWNKPTKTSSQTNLLLVLLIRTSLRIIIIFPVEDVFNPLFLSSVCLLSNVVVLYFSGMNSEFTLFLNEPCWLTASHIYKDSFKTAALKLFVCKVFLSLGF